MPAILSRTPALPIQNVGTLIENLVVTEAAGMLLEDVPHGRKLGLATAFAMPPLSEWRTHPQAVGMSSATLERVRDGSASTDFLWAMRTSLRHTLREGPSGALLVGLLAALKGRGLHVWANDLEEGHYGNAIPALSALGATVRDMVPASSTPLAITVCSTPYPESIDAAMLALERWQEDTSTVLGFLDPMRYVLDPRNGPHTSSGDHRRWLAALGGVKSVLAVHFTGNSDATTLRRELSALRTDLTESGFPRWLEVRRQHYVVSIASRTRDLLERLETRVHTAWEEWCSYSPEIKERRLNLTTDDSAG